MRRTLPSLLARLLPCVLAASLAACGGGGDGTSNVILNFQVETTSQSVAASTPLLIEDLWLAYLADEATTGAGGTDFNGDTDFIDSVPVRVNMQDGTQQVFTNSAGALAFASKTLFMVVSETSDSTDWNGDTDTLDTVLLYHTPGAASATFLASLSGTALRPMLAIGNRVFFVSDTAPTVLGDTNLFVTSVAAAGQAPSTPVRISTGIVADGDGVSVSILDEDEGLIFLTLSETLDGDLNGDGDVVPDDTVLAILDGTTTTGTVLSTALAITALDAPLRARSSAGDWLVAFLVNETAQAVNLNAPGLFSATWQPTNCVAVADVDLLDDVLHWVRWSDLNSAPALPPVNTGLVGSVAAGERLYVTPDEFVGVASLEADEGSGLGCDLNGDGDTSDRIFRWVLASTPVLPVTSATKLLALTAAVPGNVGTGGVVVLGSLWVALVNEAADGRDRDGDLVLDKELLGVHNPNNVGTGWDFTHGTQNNSYVGATWMDLDPGSTTSFLAAFSESAFELDRNGDGDLLDSIPTYPEVLSGTTLRFPGFGVGLSPTNAGMVTAGGVGFYRVSELAEGADLNGDGDLGDQVLQRLGLTTNDLPTFMGSLNTLPRPAVSFAQVGPQRAGAFLFDESLAGAGGSDINADGDGADLVVRWFRMPE